MEILNIILTSISMMYMDNYDDLVRGMLMGSELTSVTDTFQHTKEGGRTRESL